MLPDPITIAANSPTPSLVFAITSSDGTGSKRIDTGANGYNLKINHTPSAKLGDKHYLQITQTKDATDPYAATTKAVTASVSLTMFFPPFGFTTAQKVALVTALVDTLNDSEVTTTKLLLNQS